MARPVEKLSLKTVTLLLSGRCNLSCAYCYQTARRCSASMGWEGARAALEVATRGASAHLNVEFSGGEPLLERDLLRRCVDYLNAETGHGRRYTLVLTTNGTLLSGEDLAFLEKNHFRLQLSFDGMPAAQDSRGAGTFERLDWLLREMKTSWPSLFHRTRVLGAVHPEILPHLAESVSYLLARDVPDVSLYAVIGRPTESGGAFMTPLAEQFDAIVSLSVGHWERRGEIPLAIFRGLEKPDHPPPNTVRCGACRGDGLCVDPDGMAWSCALFDSSLQRLTPLAREASRRAALGHIADPDLAHRLDLLPARMESLPLVTNRLAKYSSYGRCGDCEFLPGCPLCPASISHAPGNTDPDRVPDFVCEFSRATANARRDFHRRTGGHARYAQVARVREALGALHRAILGEKASQGR